MHFVQSATEDWVLYTHEVSDDLLSLLRLRHAVDSNGAGGSGGGLDLEAMEP